MKQWSHWTEDDDSCATEVSFEHILAHAERIVTGPRDSTASIPNTLECRLSKMGQAEFTALAEIISLLQGAIEVLPETELSDLVRLLEVLRALAPDASSDTLDDLPTPAGGSVVPRGSNRQRARLRSTPDGSARRPRFTIVTSSDE